MGDNHYHICPRCDMQSEPGECFDVRRECLPKRTLCGECIAQRRYILKTHTVTQERILATSLANAQWRR